MDVYVKVFVPKSFLILSLSHFNKVNKRELVSTHVPTFFKLSHNLYPTAFKLGTSLKFYFTIFNPKSFISHI